MTDIASFYSSNTDKYSTRLKELSAQLRLVAVLRFAGFILLSFFVYRSFRHFEWITIATAITLTIVFLWLVKKSTDLGYKKLLAQKMLFINQNELEILRGGKNGFDNESHYQTGESYLADLDVFGDGSMYHFINRTSTLHGLNALAKILTHPHHDAETIVAQQEAVKSLSKQPGLNEMIIAKSLLHKEHAGNLHEVELWLHEPPIVLLNKWMNIARFLIPLVNILVLCICMYYDQYYLLSLPVLVSWLHVGYFGKYTNRQHVLIGKKEEVLKQYAEILKEFTHADAQGSTVVQQYKNNAQQAYGEIRKLSRLAGLLDQRLNLLVNIFINSFLMYDIQCLFALEKWKAKNSDRLWTWIECVGQIECLTSFATFSFNHGGYCYPTIETGKLILNAIDISHPLLPEAKSVSNSVSLGERNKLLIITGSNMSGKTTFLRSVGVNTLLAQCGLPVCAKSFHFSPVQIYSSIRISDSLQENTSYFMAELKRLSEIKQSIASQSPSLVLIDEILRGTNSEDKYYGSEQFVHQLVQYNCLTLFATHDLKLSELENKLPGIVENYCFESTIQNNELFFDYRIHKGVAQNKNASFLMKKMGII